MFLCRPLDYGESWHVDQFSIDCTEPKHEIYQGFAGLGIMVYPIGVGPITAGLLFTMSNAVTGAGAFVLLCFNVPQ